MVIAIVHLIEFLFELYGSIGNSIDIDIDIDIDILTVWHSETTIVT